MTSLPDPRHINFLLYPKGYERLIGTWGAKNSGNPTVYQLPDDAFTRFKDVPTLFYFSAAVRKHVQVHGPIDEVVVGGHGGNEMMSGGTRPELKIRETLEELARLEKIHGQPVVKRIVFSGCETFSRLSNDAIGWYRAFAKEHQIEIVGSTSYTGSTRFGRYVQFTPQGEVIRDKLDARYNPLAQYLSDRSWVDFHLNKTQTEGERAHYHHVIEQMKKCMQLPANIYQTSSVYSSLSASVAAQPNLSFDMSQDGSQGVLVRSDGMVCAMGNAKVHPMPAEQRQKMRIEYLESKLYVPFIDADGSAHVTAQVMMKDKKRMVVADVSGACAIIDMPKNPVTNYVPLARVATMATDKSHVVTVSTDGVVRSLGDVKLHPMTAQEKQHIAFNQTADIYTAYYKEGKKFLPIAQIDLPHGKMLLATQKGAYAVVDVPAGCEPAALIPLASADNAVKRVMTPFVR